MKKTRFGFISGVVFLSLIGGCITRDYRGGVPIRPSQMERINSAKTKADVADILGTPAATNMVGAEKWFYYNSEGTKFAFFDPKFSQYNILAITFDSSDNISDIHLSNLADKDIVFDTDHETDLPSDIKLHFFQELFGNIGKFSNSGISN